MLTRLIGAPLPASQPFQFQVQSLVALIASEASWLPFASQKIAVPLPGSLLLLAKELMPQPPVAEPSAIEPLVPMNVARQVPELPWPTRARKRAVSALEHGRAFAAMLLVRARAFDQRIGASAKHRSQPVESVTLLGHEGELRWKQEADALTITSPAKMPFATAIAFRIE